MRMWSGASTHELGRPDRGHTKSDPRIQMLAPAIQSVKRVAMFAGARCLHPVVIEQIDAHEGRKVHNPVEPVDELWGCL